MWVAGEDGLQTSSPSKFCDALLELTEQHFGNLTGELFPKNYIDFPSEIGDHHPNSINHQLAWTVAAACRESTKLNALVAAKRKLDTLILLGNSDEATKLVDAIELGFGKSLALLEARFLLADQRGGLAANKSLFQSVQAEIGAEYQFGIYFMSNRAERNLSFANYEKILDDIKRTNFAKYPHAIERTEFLTSLDFPTGTTHLSATLYNERLTPLIDQARSATTAFQTLIERNKLDPGAIALLERFANAIEDPNLRVLLHIAAPATKLRTSPASKSLATLSNKYSAGQYAATIAEGAVAITQWPDQLEFYDILVKSALSVGQPLSSPFPEGSPAHRILDALYHFLAKDAASPEATQALRKFALTFRGTSIGRQLHAFLARTGRSMPKSAQVVSSHPTPRLALFWNEVPPRLQYLEELKSEYESGPCWRLFRQLSSPSADTNELEDLPIDRRTKYVATWKAATGDLNGAANDLRSLLNNTHLPPHTRAEVQTELLKTLLRQNRNDDCAELIVDIAIANRNALSVGLINELLVRRAELADPIGSTAWAIVKHFSYFRSETLRDNSAVFTEYIGFLDTCGVRRASELLETNAIPHSQRLALFLDEVCVPEVMDGSIDFENTEDVENERIRICQQLIQIDPSNTERYSNEISTRTQAQAIRGAMLHLEKSKIHIDTAGIKAGLGNDFAEQFARFREFAQLSEPIRIALKRFGMKGELIIVTTDSRHLFSALFIELRDLYINSQHGLDAYLSIHIRHGTLSGQIRSLFERERLITRRDSTTGNYDANTYWSQRVFRPKGKSIDVAATKCLSAFSRQIDDIIADVKGRWIQIRTQPEPVEALFDYTYKTIPQNLYSDAADAPSLAEFVDVCLRELNARTEQNLKNVQVRIINDLGRLLTEALDFLDRALALVDTELPHSELGRAIVTCRTSIQNEVQAIASWFDGISDRILPDYSFDLAVQTAIEITKKCYPTSGFNAKIETTNAAPLLRGATFTSLVPMLFILFDNVVKHSGSHPATCKVTVDVDSNQLKLRVSNDLGPTVNFELLARKLLDISDTAKSRSGDRIRTEGGSGFFKLHKLLRHDLDCRSEYQLNIELKDARFVVEVNMHLQRVVA